MAFNILNTIKATDQPITNQSVEYIDTSLLIFSEENKFSMEQERIEALADSIIEDGFKSVIEVRKQDKKYQVICGETRSRAMMLAFEKTNKSEYKSIPVIVSDLNDEDAKIRLIVDNCLNRKLTPNEIMWSIESLKKTYEAKKEQGIKIPGRIQWIIANQIGLKKSQVGTYEKIIKNATPELKELVESGEVTIDTASKLSSLDASEQLEYIDSGKDLSKKAVEEYMDDLSNDEDDQMTIHDFIEDEDDSEEYGYEDDIDLPDSQVTSQQISKDPLVIIEAEKPDYVINQRDEEIISDIQETLEMVLSDLDPLLVRVTSFDNKLLASEYKKEIEDVMDHINKIRMIGSD